MKYTNIFTAIALESAITDALNRAGIIGGGFAVLAEGNDFGTFFITVLSQSEIAEFDNAEIADMTMFGYAICQDMQDISRYAYDYFS